MHKRMKVALTGLGVLLVAGFLVFVFWLKPDHDVKKLNFDIFAKAISSAPTTSGRSPDRDVKKLNFGTFAKSIGNAPYHVAKDFKWFEEHPDLKDIEISYAEYNDRPTISQALDKGELQMLFSAEVPAIMCRAQGNDVRVVDIASTVSLQFLVRNDSSIQSVSDLRGKKVTLLKATSSHFGLLERLKANNLQTSDIDLRYMGPGEAKVAFETGQVDAWVVWSPFIEQQIVNGKGRLLKGTDYLITNTMTVPSFLITKHERIVRALVSVIERAKQWIAGHPEEAQPIIASELGLDPPVVKEAMKRFNYSVHLSDSLTEFQEKADFLAGQEQTRLGRAVDIRKELVELRFTQK